MGQCGPLPQNNQAAEHAGLIAAGTTVVRPTHAWGDCITVVKEHALAWVARLSSKRRYAGVWRSMLQAEHPSFLTKAFWTKGHAWDRSSPEQWKAMSSQQRWEAMGTGQWTSRLMLAGRLTLWETRHGSRG